VSAPATAPVFLTADWRTLVMLNWEIDPELLRARAPRGTTIDLWNGRTFVSIVGFRFLDTRVRSVAIPFHRDFDEVNLRYYVRREGPEGPRRGVVFVKEIVPKLAIAWVARTVYNENYVSLPMRHDVRLPAPGGRSRGTATYGWTLGGAPYRLVADFSAQPEFPRPASEEAFITEHYWGYATQRDGSTVEYRVEHPPWRVWKAESAAFEGPIAPLYGAEFEEVLSRPPSSAFVAEGSEVVVRKGVSLR
jgi:uncharacterized protein YqjF (DUF2071 family)